MQAAAVIPDVLGGRPGRDHRPQCAVALVIVLVRVGSVVADSIVVVERVRQAIAILVVVVAGVGRIRRIIDLRYLIARVELVGRHSV